MLISDCRTLRVRTRGLKVLFNDNEGWESAIVVYGDALL
jgi:hypothetical protein